jgi:membrane protein implicated in regulation of membrane protease activity
MVGKLKFPKLRFTREVRDSVHTMLVGAAGVAGAWAWTNLGSRPVVLVVVAAIAALLLAIAAVLVKAVARPSEDLCKNRRKPADERSAPERRVPG